MLAAPGVTVTVGLISGVAYVAVTVVFASISTVQVAPAAVVHPVHAENTVPFVPDAFGAVIVTDVPWLYVRVKLVLPLPVALLSAGATVIATPLAGSTELTVSW
jgi:hypothetical protein